MTCIIGLVHEGKVYMGGDSAGANGWTTRATALRKVFVREFYDPGDALKLRPCTTRFLIGYTTSYRMGQLLQYHLEVRRPGQRESGEQYMVTGFAEAARHLFADMGFSEINSNKHEGGVFLVGYGQHLYRIESDYQVQQFRDGFDAVGCGSEFALGAMAVTERMKPEKRIETALKAAARFSNGVCGPFYIETLE